jgi:hypothetical protein
MQHNVNCVASLEHAIQHINIMEWKKRHIPRECNTYIWRIKSLATGLALYDLGLFAIPAFVDDVDGVRGRSGLVVSRKGSSGDWTASCWAEDAMQVEI